MQQKVPFSLIRCSSSKVAFCSCVEWGWHIYNIVESESDPLTRRAVDLFEKEPLKGNSEVHLHTPTKFGEDRSKDLGGDREQTDRQTNRQTDKRCSIYSMMWIHWGNSSKGIYFPFYPSANPRVTYICMIVSPPLWIFSNWRDWAWNGAHVYCINRIAMDNQSSLQKEK